MSEITAETFERLRAPFPSKDLEWRIGQAGKNKNGFYAKILVYITNRAVMERLDEVVGAENWKNEYKPGPDKGVVCGLSLFIRGEWVTKWDGAENSDIESVKGGLSDSMKRAAVQWGIGRYLYDIGETWAVIAGNGSHYANCKIKVDGKEEWASFNWDAPKLPDHALPENERKVQPTKKPTPAPAAKTEPPKVGLPEHTKAYTECLNAITAAATLGRCREIARNIARTPASKFNAGESDALLLELAKKEEMSAKVATKWYARAVEAYTTAETVPALLAIKSKLRDERSDMTPLELKEMEGLIDRKCLTIPQGDMNAAA